MRASRPLPLALSLLLPLSSLASPSARADPADEPGAASLLTPDPRFVSADARHAFLWHNDTDYRSAIGSRRLWTALAVVGGGGGLLVAGLAALSGFTHAYNCMTNSIDDIATNMVNQIAGAEPVPGRTCPPEPGWIDPAIYTGLIVSAVSVAVGVPLAIAAHQRVSRIRSAYPVVSVDADPRLARLTLRWHF